VTAVTGVSGTVPPEDPAEGEGSVDGCGSTHGSSQRLFRRTTAGDCTSLPVCR